MSAATVRSVTLDRVKKPSKSLYLWIYSVTRSVCGKANAEDLLQTLFWRARQIEEKPQAVLTEGPGGLFDLFRLEGYMMNAGAKVLDELLRDH